MYSWQGITIRTAPLLLVAALALTPGCGGGSGHSKEVTVTTGGSGGSDSLQTAIISPTPGSVNIGRSTAFQIAWTNNISAPYTFMTSLAHYHEPTSASPGSLDTQKITVSQTSNASWQIQRSDNLALDGIGVYILQTHLPEYNQHNYAFIVGIDRSFPASDKTRSASDTPGTGGSLSGLQISPAPGTAYIARNTIFQLSWSNSTPPPSQFQVTLWRYKEKDGFNPSSEQDIYLARQGSNYTWNFARTSNHSLDAGGTYYVEVTDLSTGNSYRAAYIAFDDNTYNNNDYSSTDPFSQ